MGDYDRGGWGNQGGFNQGGFNQGGGFNDRGGDRGDYYGGAWGGGRGGGGSRGGGFSNVRPGDWSCPNGCGNVFASKSNCFRCGVPKPEGAGDSVRRAFPRSLPPEPDFAAPRITYARSLGKMSQIMFHCPKCPLADVPPIPPLVPVRSARRRSRLRRRLGRRRRLPRALRSFPPPRRLGLPRGLRPRVCVQVQLLPLRRAQTRGRGRRLQRRRELQRRRLQRPRTPPRPRRPAGAGRLLSESRNGPASSRRPDDGIDESRIVFVSYYLPCCYD